MHHYYNIFIKGKWVLDISCIFYRVYYIRIMLPTFLLPWHYMDITIYIWQHCLSMWKLSGLTDKLSWRNRLHYHSIYSIYVGTKIVLFNHCVLWNNTVFFDLKSIYQIIKVIDTNAYLFGESLFFYFPLIIICYISTNANLKFFLAAFFASFTGNSILCDSLFFWINIKAVIIYVCL